MDLHHSEDLTAILKGTIPWSVEEYLEMGERITGSRSDCSVRFPDGQSQPPPPEHPNGPVSPQSEEPQPTTGPAAAPVPKLLTKNVFLDTSIHVGAKFVYSSGGFRRLIDLAAGDLASIFETEVDREEVTSNIVEAAAEAANGLKRFQREAVGLQAVNAPNVAPLFHPLDKDHIRDLLMREFTSYRARVQIQQISLAEADASLVFRRYFRRELPFEDKKKLEFPDAFILSALAGWCWSRAELMYVISRDKGFAAAAGAIGRGRLIPLESLDEFLNLVVSEQHQAFAIRAQRWLHANGATLNQEIEDVFLNMGFYIEDADGVAEGVEVEDMHCGRPLLVEVSAGEAVFSLSCEVTFTAELTYDDPDSVIYDKEDDVTLYARSMKTRVRRTLETDAEVRLLLHNPEESEGGAISDSEAELEEIRLNRGRDIPVSVDDELVEVFPPEHDDYDWYADLPDFDDRDEPPKEREESDPDLF